MSDARHEAYAGRPRRGQTLAAFGGLGLLLLVLSLPVERIAEELASAHMVQHLLMVLLVCPLLVLGRPLSLLLFWMPDRARPWTVRQVQNAAASAPGRLTSTPLIPGLVHAAAIWVWHLPGPYQAALGSPPLHALEHLSFLATAYLFWRAVVRAERSQSYLAATMLVLGTALQSCALGVVLAFSPFVLYPAQGASAAKWGLSALEDQQLAGAIMWIPSGGVYLATILFLLARAFTQTERKMLAEEGRAPGPVGGGRGADPVRTP